MRKNYALWLFSADRKDEAASEMGKAIALEPADTRKFITAMVLGKLTPAEIREAIPQNATAMSLYGRYREDTGSIDEALDAYLNALSLMKIDGKSSPEIYLRIGFVYEKKESFHQALAFYEEGAAENPANHSLIFSLARLYDRLNMPHKAIGYYERVLLLVPGNLHAQKRLKELNKER
jgi:tetratricopeptide (TPR) repeat protein